MSMYKLRCRIPACELSVELLRSLEAYLKKYSMTAIGDGDVDFRDRFSLVVEEPIGSLTLSSASDFYSEKLPDSTKCVEVSLDDEKGLTNVRINFDKERVGAIIEADFYGQSSREDAVGFRDGVFRVIEPFRSMGAFYHPSVYLEALSIAMVPFSFVGFFWAFNRIELGWMFSALFVAFSIVLLYRIGATFNTYITFNSRRNDAFKKIWMWFVAGVATFVVFGCLFPYVKDKIL